MADKYSVKFLGDTGLIKIEGSDRLWIVDGQKRQLIPFASDQAFVAFSGGRDPKSLQEGVDFVTVPMDLFIGDNELADFSMLKLNQGVQNTGTIPKSSSQDSSSINLYYGKQKDATAQEKQFESLARYLSFWKSSGGSGISNETFTEVMNDPEQLGFYVNAITYGGYDATDVFKDLKRRDLSKQGNTAIGELTVIDPSLTRSAFLKTSGGKATSNATALNMPATIGSVDSSLFKLSIFNIPDTAYKAIVPLLDITSEEFKKEAESVKTAYYDVLMQALEATTDQEKAIADYAYTKFKNDINKRYNIQLSDNAMDAWSQIESFEQTMSGRGLSGSGVEYGAIQDYLKSVRRGDQRLRDAKLSEEKTTELNYLLKSGTDDQINAYISKIQNDATLSDEEKSRLVSLFKPTEEMRKAFSYETLKAKYPDLDDTSIRRLSNSLFTTSGNIRSELYQNLYSREIYDIMNPTASAQVQKEEEQRNILYAKREKADEKAMQEWTENKGDVLNYSGTKPAEETVEEDVASVQTVPAVQPTPKYSPASAPTGFTVNPKTGYFEKMVTEQVKPIESPYNQTSTVKLSNPKGDTMDVLGSDVEYWKTQGWNTK